MANVLAVVLAASSSAVDFSRATLPRDGNALHVSSNSSLLRLASAKVQHDLPYRLANSTQLLLLETFANIESWPTLQESIDFYVQQLVK